MCSFTKTQSGLLSGVKGLTNITRCVLTEIVKVMEHLRTQGPK